MFHSLAAWAAAAPPRHALIAGAAAATAAKPTDPQIAHIAYTAG